MNERLPHPLAIVRKIAGLSQKELAGMIGKSYRTIQSVELGDMKMSRPLAQAVAAVTGVERFWLQVGTGEPKMADGRRFTEATFQEFRTNSIYANFEESHGSYVDAVAAKLWDLTNALEMAVKAPESKGALFALDDLILTIRSRYGADTKPTPEAFADVVIKRMSEISAGQERESKKSSSKKV